MQYHWISRRAYSLKKRKGKSGNPYGIYDNFSSNSIYYKDTSKFSPSQPLALNDEGHPLNIKYWVGNRGWQDNGQR